MKKVRIKPTTADTSIRPVVRHYKDEIQKMVEYHFAQGLEAHEISDKLGLLDAKEMERRYNQVLRQYVAATDQLTVETAKIEMLRILKRSLIRRDTMVQEVERKKRRLTAGIDNEFPNKEIANLREEDKFIYKIMSDMDKTIRPRGKDMSEKAIEAVKKADNAESTRSYFQEIVVDYKTSGDVDILNPDLEADLRASMEEEEW
jgi:hypothetical protein